MTSHRLGLGDFGDVPARAGLIVDAGIPPLSVSEDALTATALLEHLPSALAYQAQRLGRGSLRPGSGSDGC